MRATLSRDVHNVHNKKSNKKCATTGDIFLPTRVELREVFSSRICPCKRVEKPLGSNSVFSSLLSFLPVGLDVFVIPNNHQGDPVHRSPVQAKSEATYAPAGLHNSSRCIRTRANAPTCPRLRDDAAAINHRRWLPRRWDLLPKEWKCVSRFPWVSESSRRSHAWGSPKLIRASGFEGISSLGRKRLVLGSVILCGMSTINCSLENSFFNRTPL